MEHKVEKDMAKEKILTVKSVPDDTEIKESKPLYRRRKCQLCCCLGVGLIVLMGIILLILVFAVFKAKDPDVRVNGVKLAHLNITYGSLVPQIQLMLDLNITVHNPNRASFKYTNGSSILYYQAIEVGHGDIPAGRLGAGHTMTEVVTLNVQADKFLMGSNFTKDFAAGMYSSILFCIDQLCLFQF
ncbi:hypothetical protein M758_1G107800 [Ceratodon purpureus]|uniref:Late embryogenesis abundant protein LEA-2 subgroup domain-containing protein n=1 Tax=Ceratodon purpureus TaxID=3225 RepID=A0A8T0J3D3_CERPU|nr:hypothetical protein KC19_1G100000 [Ceratodon purpureus]KAG0629489.1 hypothetical protein M758_1G107800 [Ceratodon purpureus]